MDAPRVSFANCEEMDVAFLLNSLSPKSLIHRFRQDVPRELDGLAREYERFAEKQSLHSPRNGLPKFHFLCASLVDNEGSVFPDVRERYRTSQEPFRVLIEKGKRGYSATKSVGTLGDFVRLWEKRALLLEKAQEIARIGFRLHGYTVFVLLSLSGRFGMPCMVHDKYVFVNAQEQQEGFIVDAVFHELLHQLLLGYRCSVERGFFVGRFLWQPRRAMMEEMVLPCVEMELCEDSEKRDEKREFVLHLDEHLSFLKPLRSLFSKVLHDWEEGYILSQDMNLQDFIDVSARKHLKPLKFVSAMRRMSTPKKTSQSTNSVALDFRLLD